MRHASLLGCAAAVALIGTLAACGGDTEQASSASGGSAASSSVSSAGAGGPGSGGASSSSGAGAGTPSTVDCDPASGSLPTLKLTEIAAGLDDVMLVKSAPDDPDRLYIVQKTGVIAVYDKGAVLPTPFLDISGLLRVGSEEGFLGLAFHPAYADNGRFFVHYSAADNGDSTVQEFKRSASDPLVADPNPVQLVLKHSTEQDNHNGGTTEFGKDGFLYIGLGDGGMQGDPECDAQNKGNLLGKISRIDVDGTPDSDGYPAAAGNPDGAKYYHIGFRNPWRMSFDACTFDLYIGDVGQDAWEEVSVVAKADGPKNFGWPFREGTHDFGVSACAENTDTLVEPITDYSHGDGNNCVIGGYVYRGSTIPALRGTYFFGDNNTGRVWTLQYTNGMASPPVEVPELNMGGTLASFGQDGRGQVYTCGTDGTVYRIDPQ